MKDLYQNQKKREEKGKINYEKTTRWVEGMFRNDVKNGSWKRSFSENYGLLGVNFRTFWEKDLQFLLNFRDI